MHKPTRFLEFSAFTLGVAICINLFQSWLIQGNSILSHDNFYWNYPIFHLFAENMIFGQIPWWNPFDHGGEPFYPALTQIRLFDPVALISVGIGRFIDDHITLLYAWFRFSQSVILALGAYLYLRRFCDTLLARLILIPALLFSSWMLGPFRSDGLINHMLWIPYLLLVCDALVEKNRSVLLWIVLGGLIGINFQSYFFVGMTLILPLYFIPLAKTRPPLWGPLISLLVLIPMAAPNFTLYGERHQFVYPSRSAAVESTRGGSLVQETNTAPDTPALSTQDIQLTGSHWSFWNVIQTLAPRANHFYVTETEQSKTWGNPSDAYLYFGVLLWCAFLWGLLTGRHPLKKIWLTILILFLAILLGSPYLPFSLYPPLKLVRHTSLLLMYVELGVLFFAVLGLNSFLSWRGQPKPARALAMTGILLIQAAVILYFAPNRFSWAWHFIGFSIVPVGGFLFFRKQAWAPLLILFSVALDLFVHAKDFSHLYAGTPNPNHLFSVRDTPQVPELLRRDIAAPCPAFFNQYFQCPRHLAVLYREPFLFSSLRFSQELPDPLENAWKSLRWDSLYWLKSYQDALNDAKTSRDLETWFAIHQDAIEFAGSVQVTGYSYNALWLTVKADKPGALVWHDAWTQGWKAYLDEKPTTIETNRALDKRIQVPAGQHQITFAYDPRKFRLSIALYEVLALVTLTLLLAHLIAGLRHQPNDAHHRHRRAK